MNRTAAGVWWGGGLALGLSLLALAPLVSNPTPWENWPLTPAITLGLALVGALYLRGARSEPVGRRAAFLGGLASLFLALQSPLAAMAPHSFAFDALAQMLLRTVAPALLILAQPGVALRAGLTGYSVVTPRRFARLGGPVVATLVFVGTVYVWAWPAARNLTLVRPGARMLMDLTFLGSGLLFFRSLFDLRPEPDGPGIGTRLLMVWGAELGNVVLGYYLTYISYPLYAGYAARGLLFGTSPLTNQMYGGQTWWLCDTAAIGLAAMTVIFRWARDEDRLRGRRHWLEDDPATRRARQQAANRKVALGLLGFVAMILGIIGASVAVYEVGYHRAVRQAPTMSVNQIP